MQTQRGRDAGGAGLGLSICAGNVELLGGRIGLDGLPGGGACFWFEFPAAADHAVADLAGSGDEEAAEPMLGRRLREVAATAVRSSAVAASAL